jgi:hypothetical protein
VFGSFNKLGCVSVFVSYRSDHRRRTYLWILVKTAATSYVGDHLFCKISKHSSPVP